MRTPIVTLLTDFGTADGYVGAIKGVLSSLCPQATLVDITHEIPPGDVRAGAFALSTAAPLFPPGTVHLAVVDPGVGSSRRGLLVESAASMFVGPDNGLLARAARAPRRILSLERDEWLRRPVSATFHGRDVFAPIAALVAAGTPPARLGVPVESMVELALPSPIRSGSALVGEIIHVDRFGNLVTNLPADEIPADPGSATVEIGEQGGIVFVDTYASGAPGAAVALVGSGGLIEIAVRDGSAARILGGDSRVGTPVRLRARPR